MSHEITTKFPPKCYACYEPSTSVFNFVTGYNSGNSQHTIVETKLPICDDCLLKRKNKKKISILIILISLAICIIGFFILKYSETIALILIMQILIGFIIFILRGKDKNVEFVAPKHRFVFRNEKYNAAYERLNNL
jgi:hypothetical protein